MNIYIQGTGFATQGPCENGFHVPLSTEWQAVYDAGISLGAWTSTGGDSVKTYLKMPYSGRRDGSNSNIDDQGSRGHYRSCNMSTYGKYFLIDSSHIAYNGNEYTTSGKSIRPFKDTPVVPDSSWTELYTDGIYHNSTLGLISIKNGSSWITISDKNLGATIFYNSGDTLSQNNCGKYYQRGNNYGFQFTGTVTTSSTKVNAGTYGPGNYYESSTYITVSASNWDSSNNTNLRGGVDGNVPVSQELQNAYIGEYTNS